MDAIHIWAIWANSRGAGRKEAGLQNTIVFIKIYAVCFEN